MNVVKIMGGVGNQLFQYAFGKVLEKTGKEVAFDVSWGDTKTCKDPSAPRPIRLPMFQVTNLKTSLFLEENPTINEANVGYDLGLFNMKNSNNFEGYWQYYPYYKAILPILKNEFQLRTEVYSDKFLEYAEMIWKTDSISLHVRRGDYQKHRRSMFRDLTAPYYFEALSKVKDVKGNLFVFSDDLPWCKETFKQEFFSRKIIFVDIEDYLAFELMRFCKHNVITNSTFSWWAAWLNDNSDKIVVCPNRYLCDSEEISNKRRHPQEWIKVNDHATHW